MTTPAETAEATDRWALRRVRHEVRRRVLTVTAVERLSPGMLRLVFASPDLADFVSAGFDDHIKLFFPIEGGEPAMRDYTPRSFDNAAATLVIDFAVHEAGPATAWALSAKVGDTLNIGGPRGSVLIPEALPWLVLIGDETALPAIGRRLEEAQDGETIATLAIVDAADDALAVETKAAWTPHWLVRDGSDDTQALTAALDAVLPADKEGFIWLAAEARVAKALRAHLVEVRGFSPKQIKAAGYWVRGAEGVHERIE
ncbi:NADPH-dependent ferric siderophore reductase [Caulobacter sp. D4A]|uniref:siderophore-interacting protein n=1 Tax=unclassified Caulobacter TaxID=2648921 RepID=UPI000D7258B9|nr:MULTISPECIES: siderophore-interacting protein [unclassified Caulobacter]PXA74321.1 NADPH-dependent ferric siderophore reductase [Caulobacter sp. D4A]PXA87516.1 NADPH-dependent ferric siderophore reductase [Caulobacter sp. D5]